MLTKEQNDYNNQIIDEYTRIKNTQDKARKMADYAASVIFLWGIIVGLFLGGVLSVLIFHFIGP